MTEYTNEQIMENRQKWIDFLILPETKKGTGYLDRGYGTRCCLGHGAFILGVHSVVHNSSEIVQYGLERESYHAPVELVEMVGLHAADGSSAIGENGYHHNMVSTVREDYTSLASLNDASDWTPQQIGEYLKTVIHGGDNTPFKKLV